MSLFTPWVLLKKIIRDNFRRESFCQREVSEFWTNWIVCKLVNWCLVKTTISWFIAHIKVSAAFVCFRFKFYSLSLAKHKTSKSMRLWTHRKSHELAINKTKSNNSIKMARKNHKMFFFPLTLFLYLTTNIILEQKCAEITGQSVILNIKVDGFVVGSKNIRAMTVIENWCWTFYWVNLINRRKRK